MKEKFMYLHNLRMSRILKNSVKIENQIYVLLSHVVKNLLEKILRKIMIFHHLWHARHLNRFRIMSNVFLRSCLK